MAHEIAATVVGRAVVISTLRADVGSGIRGQILMLRAAGMPVGLAVPGSMRVPTRNVRSNKRKRHQG